MASFRSILRKGRKLIRSVDPLTDKVLENTKDIPGSAGAFSAAVESDASTRNLYGTERGFFDIWAGGDKLSQDPDARAVGRTVGSAFAGYYGAAAAGAGTSSAATAAAAAGQTAIDMQGREIAQEIAEQEAARQRELIAVMREEEPQPEAIPIADEEAMRRRRRRSLASVLRRRGRQSTILTGGGSGALGA